MTQFATDSLKKGRLSFAPGLDFVIEVFHHKIVLGYLEIEVTI